MRKLSQIVTAFYTAGLEWEDGKIIKAAPIIGWMKKQKLSEEEVIIYCDRKGYLYRVIENTS